MQPLPQFYAARRFDFLNNIGCSNPESFHFLTILVAQVKGIEESDVTPGFVLCCPANPIKTGKVFDAQVSSKMKGFAFY